MRAVALCAADDTVLRPLAERLGIEVIVDGPASTRRPGETPLTHLKSLLALRHPTHRMGGDVAATAEGAVDTR